MKTLVIDFGHGGKDWGAVNDCLPLRLAPKNKEPLKEKDVVLSLMSRIDALTEDMHLNVVYTRREDVYESLSKRVEIANKVDADLFFSIHCNAANRLAHGMECYSYRYSNRSKLAAERCQKALTDGFPDHLDRGAKKANFKVLRETNMTAVLWELEFIDTLVGAEALTSKESLDRYALCIVQSALDILHVDAPKKVNQVGRKVGRIAEKVCSCMCLVGEH